MPCVAFPAGPVIDPDNAENRLLLDCYRSGQISERQWTEHLKDVDFAAWLALVEPVRP